MTIKTLVVKIGATPGVLVQVTDDDTLRADKVIVEPLPGNTGSTFIGLAGLVRSTFANVAHVFTTANVAPYEISSKEGSSNIKLSDLWLDANVGLEGIIVTYFVS